MGSKAAENKGIYILFSLLIAIALWLYVVSVVNPGADTVIRDLPLALQGGDTLESRGLVVTSLSRREIDLYLDGNRMALGIINAQNTTATLDLSSITEVGTFTLKYRYSLPATVTSGAVSAPEERNDFNIIVTVAKRMSKSIEIRGEFAGSVADGFQVAPVQVSPATITVSGQEDHVNRVAYGLVEVIQENMASTFSGELGFSLIDAAGVRLTGLNITCSAESVLVVVPVVQVREIPLAVEIQGGGGAAAENAEVIITPGYISVSGEEEDLEPLREIKLGVVDLSKILNTETYHFDIPLAPQLTNESGTAQATVTVKVSGLSSKLLETDNIEIINVPEGYSATAVTHSLQVVVRGSEEALGMVTSNHLRVVADLKGMSMSLGQVRVPVKIYLDGGSGAGVVGGDYSISVTIAR